VQPGRIHERAQRVALHVWHIGELKNVLAAFVSISIGDQCVNRGIPGNGVELPWGSAR